jgi:MinD-like ATPase involved in chromosome partitioning or flagellar assembly
MVAVGGPKGGTGSTFVAVSVAVMLARHDRRVILIDAASGRETIHTHLALERPRPLPAAPAAALADIVRRRIVETGQPNLGYCAIALPPSWPEIARIVALLMETDPDVVVVDLPSESNELLGAALSAADAGVLITAPNRPGVELIHRFLKERTLDRLVREATQSGLSVSDDTVERAFDEGDLVALIETTASRLDAAGAERFHRAVYGRTPLFIGVNKTRRRDDHFLAPAFCEIGEKLYGYRLVPLNPIANDSAAADIDDRRLYIDERPNSETTACLDLTAKRLLQALGLPHEEEAPHHRSPVNRMNHYELLNLTLDAPVHAVEQAYLQLSYIYSHQAMAGHGGLSDQTRKGMVNVIHEAYYALSDRERRAAYDATLSDVEKTALSVDGYQGRFQRLAELGMSVEREKTQGASVALASGSDITGGHLRNIRLAKGLTLEEIAEATKIKKSFLEAIENEDQKSFPAPIFLRGFLKSYAKALGLDPTEICDKYLVGAHPVIR